MGVRLAAKTDYPDHYPVPYVEKKPMNDPEPNSDLLVLNIQKDVRDLRLDLRVTDGRIESLRERFEKCREDDKRALDAQFEKVDARFEKVEARFEKAEQRREEDRKEIDARFDKVDEVRSLNFRLERLAEKVDDIDHWKRMFWHKTLAAGVVILVYGSIIIAGIAHW
jgi:predicted  nucleic acid-binding Zn-ribbon protein